MASQRGITRKRKHDHEAFLSMCKTSANNVPFAALAVNDEASIAAISHELRHLALIDIPGLRFTRMPLANGVPEERRRTEPLAGDAV